MPKRKHQNEPFGPPDEPEKPASSPLAPTSPLSEPEKLADTTPPSEHDITGGARTALPVTTVGASSTQHILFGSVEDVLADLHDRGAPDGNVVRVERLVRTRQHTMGGVATQGVLITARRDDEVLSAWVIVGRLALDLWGRPLDHERARASAERHCDAQRVIGAQVADVGFAVRTGLYLLPDAGYGFAATSASLDTLNALAARATPNEDTPGADLLTNEVHTQREQLEGGEEHA